MLVFIFTALLGETNKTGATADGAAWIKEYRTSEGSEFWQTSFLSLGDYQCANINPELLVLDAVVPDKCKRRVNDGEINDGKTRVVNENMSVDYYKRGAGFLPLEGIDDYTRFSDLFFEGID